MKELGIVIKYLVLISLSLIRHLLGRFTGRVISVNLTEFCNYEKSFELSFTFSELHDCRDHRSVR